MVYYGKQSLEAFGIRTAHTEKNNTESEEHSKEYDDHETTISKNGKAPS